MYRKKTDPKEYVLRKDQTELEAKCRKLERRLDRLLSKDVMAKMLREITEALPAGQLPERDRQAVALVHFAVHRLVRRISSRSYRLRAKINPPRGRKDGILTLPL